MSADNGVYIGEFPTANDGKEYRVIEAQAIENVDYGNDPEYHDYMRLLYFGEAKSLSTMEEAMKEAARLYKECIEDFGFCEYDISTIVFDRPLINKTVDEAHKWTMVWDRSETIKHGNIPCANLECGSFISPDEQTKTGDIWYCSPHCNGK